MSAQALQENDLLELLLQLKKTTPEQARIILNGQPQIASAVLAVMVNINAVNMDVVQKTLAGYGALPGAAPSAPSAIPPVALPAAPVITSAPAIPPHMALPPPVRGGTPTYPPPQQPPAYAQPGPYASHVPGPSGYGPLPPLHAPAYAAPPAAAAPTPAPGIPGALASIPEDQKALIMKVISMTRDEIYQLPYDQRNNIIQLRATLGLPT